MEMAGFVANELSDFRAESSTQREPPQRGFERGAKKRASALEDSHPHACGALESLKITHSI